MTYEEYEEMKIQEAGEIAKGILNGTVKTIPFEDAMKLFNETLNNLEEEYKNKSTAEEKGTYAI